MALPTKRDGPAFVPIVAAAARPMVAEAAPPTPAMTVAPVPPSVPTVEVALAGAVVRVAPRTDGALLTAVLRAVRASAA